MEIKVLPAYQGDSILIKFNDFNLLIDCGTKKFYSQGTLKEEFEALNKIDLFILTHTDDDHIGGILKYYADSKRKSNFIKKVFFNSALLISRQMESDIELNKLISINDSKLNVSIGNAIKLESFLLADGILHEELVIAGKEYNLDFCKLIIVSPDIEDLYLFYNNWELEKSKNLKVSFKNDYDKTIEELTNKVYKEQSSLANKTSIALIVKYQTKNLLMMGDAVPSIIEKNLRSMGFSEKNKLKLDLVKISHHGGNIGISNSLLKIIDCNKFVISTNGSNGLPTKECLARIITHKVDKKILYFNYKNMVTKSIFLPEDYLKYNFEVIYLTDLEQNSIKICEEN